MIVNTIVNTIVAPARDGAGTRFLKGYNEKNFESEKFPLRVTDTEVRGAQINVLELKFSLFAQRTTFFAAKKFLRGGLTGWRR